MHIFIYQEGSRYKYKTVNWVGQTNIGEAGPDVTSAANVMARFMHRFGDEFNFLEGPPEITELAVDIYNKIYLHKEVN